MISGKIPVVSAGITPSGYHSEYNAKGPVVSISASGANAGYISLYLENVWASDCSYFNPDSTPYVFYYYSLMDSKRVEITRMQRGAAQPHVYPKDLMRLKIISPTTNIVERFENLSSKIFTEIGILKDKNKNLQQTRDLLLPKLINGQVDVSNLDIIIPEVEA
jgi:type I restriction enzyme S subunit